MKKVKKMLRILFFMLIFLGISYSQAQEQLPKSVSDCLGHGYDWTESVRVEPNYCKRSVIDIKRLFAEGMIEYKNVSSSDLEKTQTAQGYETENQLVKRLSANLGIDASFIDISLHAQLKNGEKNNSKQSYYFMYADSIYVNSNYFIDKLEITDLKPYVKDEFLNFINTKSPQEIVRVYGTHIVTNVSIGRKISVFFKEETSEVEQRKSKKTEIGGSIKTTVSTLEIDVEKEESNAKRNAEMNSNENCKSFGYKDCKDKIEDPEVFVHISKNPPLKAFIEITEFIDDASKKEEMKNYLQSKMPSKYPCGLNCPNMEFILIKGKEFQMGSEDGMENERPVHRVVVRDFEMSKTEVTVGQYRACVDDGACSEAGSKDRECNWTNQKSSKENHPINCVDWNQARSFAKWVGGDLASEAQWEYASRSGGRNIKYPWGNGDPTCEIVNFNYGCHKQTTPVCSNIGGNTAQGLCDTGGNVWEWVLDEWHGSYSDAPSDYIAWCSDRGCSSNTSAVRVFRGGSWSNSASNLRSASRGYNSPGNRATDIGFRVARSVH